MSNIAHKFVESFRKVGEISNQTFPLSLANSIEYAQKFSLGKYTQDEMASLLKEGWSIRDKGHGFFPFEVNYFEIKLDATEYFVLCTQKRTEKGGFGMVLLEKPAGNKGATFALFVLSIDTDIKRTSIHKMSDVTSFYDAEPIPDIPKEQMEIQESLYIGILHIIQALLGSRATAFEEVPAPKKLNKARKKKGRTPLFDYHELKIGGVAKDGRLIAHGGTHASPRAHMRAGHMRTYHAGTDKEFKRFVRSSQVNGKGFVFKEYTMQRDMK